MSALLYKEEVFAIAGAAMEVYNHLGSGFYEAVYQEALEIELQKRGIPFRGQVALPVSYKGIQLKKEYVADLICYDNIIVELKAEDVLTNRETAQALNYLKATGYRLAVIINFGNKSGLDWKRVVL